MNDCELVLLLAKALRQPVRKIKDMPSTLLEQWKAYYRITPYGDDE